MRRSRVAENAVTSLFATGGLKRIASGTYRMTVLADFVAPSSLTQKVLYFFQTTKYTLAMQYRSQCSTDQNEDQCTCHSEYRHGGGY